MAEEVEVTEDIVEENGHNPMLEMARKVLLASIGAMALTQEEIEKFVSNQIKQAHRQGAYDRDEKPPRDKKQGYIPVQPADEIGPT